MESPLNRKVCFCIPIKIGVWTLVIISLIGATWAIVEGVIFFASGLTGEEVMAQRGWTTPAWPQRVLAIASVENGMKLGIGVPFLILSILLVYGVHYRKPEFLRGWVKGSVVFLELGGLVWLAILIMRKAVLERIGIDLGWLDFILWAIVLVSEGIYIWVVNKYTQLLEKEGGVEVGMRKLKSVAASVF